MKRISMLVVSLLMLVALGTAFAQDAKPYKDGPVTRVNFVKVKPGQFNNYIKYLDGPYKANMEAMKKAGLITGYAVYETEARSPHDADLILTTTFANMAALDRNDEADAVAAKVLGARDARDKAAADRESMRELLGGQLTRELILK
ncbi:hypothetical protein ACXU4B_01630 [Dyella soli]|uniref:Uncharacterized protein n=1 Tax=Dyella soli TaxID=522319 RepID=A0A4R0YTF3_9GAMM|nr:hypothetical protein [Dyella soli]TCI09772.1 hypothetical protein EZM97_12495 [Dyella soli]